jgi:hypothetical protein
MAQQPRDRRRIAPPVCTCFEPGHLAEACLVEAYARLVPPRRRARLPLPPSASLDVGAGGGRVPSPRQQPREEGERCS